VITYVIFLLPPFWYNILIVLPPLVGKAGFSKDEPHCNEF